MYFSSFVFEASTWASFDYLREKINENNKTSKNIESICNNLHHNQQPSNVNQIYETFPVGTFDSISRMSEKCSLIEDKVNSLVEKVIIDKPATVTVPHDTSQPKDELNTTQDFEYSLPELRRRFHNLLDSEVSDSTIHPNENKSTSESTNTEFVNKASKSNRALRNPPPLTLISNRTVNTKELYLTRLTTATTAEIIENYMLQRGLSKESIKITRLVSKKRDTSTLSFVSLKIDTTNNIANIISAPSFWPRGCYIKEFVHKVPRVVNLVESSNSDHFLSAVNEHYNQT